MGEAKSNTLTSSDDITVLSRKSKWRTVRVPTDHLPDHASAPLDILDTLHQLVYHTEGQELMRERSINSRACQVRTGS